MNARPDELASNPPNANPTGATVSPWLSVADFAAARGCSPRTVKRWIEAGEIETRKDGGRRWVRARLEPLQKGQSEGTEGTPKGTRQKGHEPGAVSLSVSNHAQSKGQKGHLEGTKGTPERDRETAQVVTLSSAREAELKTEIQFLRGLVEGHQRAEAELRAALRDALKSAPKQLTAGDTSAGAAQPQTAPQSAPATARATSSDGGELSHAELMELCARIGGA